MIGQTLGHYRIESKLGEGGMGVVYKAQDTHLDRPVAIKILPAEQMADEDRKRRFIQEAKAASALNHPSIITVHDVAYDQGVDFIVMEFVAGQTLGDMIGRGGMDWRRALDYATQMAEALAAAHGAGIVHRDLKPGNIMVTGEGLVKILDFGLAKLTERSRSGGPAPDAAKPRTEPGALIGTVAYMSPEQAEGKPVETRSDVFSFGVLLYEMLAGRRPFQADSEIGLLIAILQQSPAPLKTIRKDVPKELERVVERCLEKDGNRRYASGSELRADLQACQSRMAAPGLGSILRRPRFAIPALVLLAALLAGVAWYGVHSSRVRWARRAALPQVAELVEKGNFDAAFRLAAQAQRYAADDPQFQRLWGMLTSPLSIRTTPPDAEVRVKGYLSNAGWVLVGKTPMENVRVPFGYNRWRLTKEGFAPREVAFPGMPLVSTQFVLDALGAAPAGMVRIPGGPYQFRSAAPVELQDYWLDQHEVTNRQFKAFVDQGGYEKREYWKHPFQKDGKTLPWEEAMAEFRDGTGRPGPSTWEFGAYPEDRAEFPVNGVSWYEAAAYAEFAGKSLPTVYHWYKAAGVFIYADILRVSNFGGQGPARVGAHQGLSPYGTYDMAGNVKEWCWNLAGGRRYRLGGAWNEPSYMFHTEDAAPPLDRSPVNGFRCARYTGPLSEGALAAVETFSRDWAKEKPVGEEVFRFYKSMYAYDRTELNPVVESADDTAEHWRREKVSFNAAYGNERVTAYLFLPKNAAPPYQTVIYLPGASAMRIRSSENLAEWRAWHFLIRGGRAVFYPVYKGTYERRLAGKDFTYEELSVKPGGTGMPFGPNQVRDLVVYWSKDLGRAIDYLETRRDIEREKIAFQGLSTGAVWGPVLVALEPRFKAAVLLGGGLSFEKLPAEIEAFHFAPRVKVPTLMINGRNDFVYPVQTSQAPLFRFLGAEKKRHALFDSGHVPPPDGVVKESLEWLDSHLGPVKR